MGIRETPKVEERLLVWQLALELKQGTILDERERVH